jgi:hypothetical protein
MTEWSQRDSGQILQLLHAQAGANQGMRGSQLNSKQQSLGCAGCDFCVWARRGANAAAALGLSIGASCFMLAGCAYLHLLEMLLCCTN